MFICTNPSKFSPRCSSLSTHTILSCSLTQLSLQSAPLCRWLTDLHLKCRLSPQPQNTASHNISGICQPGWLLGSSTCHAQCKFIIFSPLPRKVDLLYYTVSAIASPPSEVGARNPGIIADPPLLLFFTGNLPKVLTIVHPKCALNPSIALCLYNVRHYIDPYTGTRTQTGGGKMMLMCGEQAASASQGQWPWKLSPADTLVPDFSP